MQMGAQQLLFCLTSTVVSSALAMRPAMPDATAKSQSFHPYPDNKKLNNEFWAWYTPSAVAVKDEKHQEPRLQAEPSLFFQKMAESGQSASIIDTSRIYGLVGNEVSPIFYPIIRHKIKVPSLLQQLIDMVGRVGDIPDNSAESRARGLIVGRVQRLVGELPSAKGQKLAQVYDYEQDSKLHIGLNTSRIRLVGYQEKPEILLLVISL